MKNTEIKITAAFYLLFLPLFVYPKPNDNSYLKQEFDLAKEHSQKPQYFLMESRLITFALDGTRLSKDVFKLRLKYDPAMADDRKDDEYSCVSFSIRQGDSVEFEIPALENWTYVFNDSESDSQGYVFGIDHGKFEGLVDSEGNSIAFDKSYHVYNAFIDFHAFCNVFADPTTDGKGIQDLNKIGQKIIHAAAFSEPPTNLGSNISEGSFFKNGEISLEFKGLSIENGKSCALIGFDSGESSFKMIMKPVPNLDIISVGSSHYKGDIYKDLASNWVQKVTLNEVVITETTMPMPPNKINSVVERNITILNVSKEKFYDF